MATQNYDLDLVNLATTQFTSNVELLLQQKGSLLRGTVRTGAHIGKAVSPVNQIAPIVAKAPQGRFSPKARTPQTFDRRWVFPSDAEIDQYIDSFDELKTIVDPKSAYVENAANAIGRRIDDIIINAATAAAQLGVDEGGFSGNTVAFPSANVVAVNFHGSTTTGMTVDKIIESRRLLQHFHNDIRGEKMVLVIGSQQESDLLNQVEVVSTEFSERPVLTDGHIARFLGMDVIVTERLPFGTLDGTNANERGCLVYMMSGIYLSTWKDLVNRASIRNDLSGEPWDLYTASSVGAVRTQENKVIQILAYDTTGADTNP